MIRMYAIWFLLCLSHASCFWILTEPKFSKRKTTLFYLFFCAAFLLLLTLFYLIFGEMRLFYGVGFTSTLILAFFVFAMTSADPICKKIFLFISYANVFCIFACVSLILCRVFLSGASELVVFYVRNILRTVLFIPAAFLYIRILRPVVRVVAGKRRKTWYSISFVSLLFLCTFAIIVFFFLSDYANLDKYIPFFGGAVLVYVSVVWVIFGTIKSLILQNNAEFMQQNVAFLQSQLKAAKKYELVAKTTRHDFRHHNQNLEVMLRRGETNEALRYLQQYNDSLEATKSEEFCPNITVNAILNSFCAKAKKSGVLIFAEADIDTDTAVSDMDFTAILSNLLENAINGCIACGSDGEITANLRTIGTKTVIVCSNPCKESICIENGLIRNRGVGIGSILAAIRKYDGDIKYTLDDGILTVCVILNS